MFLKFLKFDKKITVDSSDVPFRFTFPRKPTVCEYSNILI